MNTIPKAFNMFFSVCIAALLFTSPIVITSGQTEEFSEDWPMFRLNYNHTGYKEALAPDTNTISWIFNTTTNNRWVVSSPMIVDDYVYIGSDNAKLYKLYLNNGTEVWNYTVREDTTGCAAQFWSSPCVDKENGLVFCHASGVHAVDMETGEQVWHMETNTREFSSPVVHEGVLYVGSYSKILYALDEFTGDIIWYYLAGEYQNGLHVEGTGGAISTTVAIADGVLYGAEQTNYDEGNNYCDYNIFALPLEDPDGNGIIDHDEILWKYEIGEHIPIIDTGIPGDNGDCFSSPSINQELGQVYIGSRDQHMYALSVDPQDDGWDNDGDGISNNEGELIWRFQTDNEVFSSPSIHEGNIFFGSGAYALNDPGSMYCLRESDGGEVWSYQNPTDGFLSSALVADGKVYMGCNDDNLYSFNETDGEIIWEYTAESDANYNSFGSSPSLYKEWVVIGSCNGLVYAFRDEPFEDTADGDDDDDNGFFSDISSGGSALAVFGLFILIFLVLAVFVIRKRGSDWEQEGESVKESELNGENGEPEEW